MQSNMIRFLMPVLAILLIVTSACNPVGGLPTSTPPVPEQPAQIPVAGPLATATVPPTLIPSPVIHTMTPAAPKGGKLAYDVESVGTGPEQRAPYGDSYEINRLERPFTQDMNYVPDLDISHFIVANDSDWWYASIELIGTNPNNPQGINYGVEMDLDHDGYGDYLIWAHPPYTNQWETSPVQIYQDKNHNTGGVSPGKSDAPFGTDGYETLVFDGVAGGPDPDMAWVRIKNGESQATVQFAFKRSWSGNAFMLGVIADAGWKDPKKLDYVDRILLAEAGSPMKENMYYPLKALFLVDNTCREPFGFEASRYELQVCPIPVQPTKTPGPPIPDTPQPAQPGQPFCPPTSPNCPHG